MSQNQKTPPRFTNPLFTIEEPRGDSIQAVGVQGVVAVSVDCKGNPATFSAFAKVLVDDGTAPGNLDPNAWDVFPLSRVGQTTEFSHPAVFVAAAARAANGLANRVFVKGSDGTNTFTESQPFKARVESANFANLTVEASRSIWFAWAPRNYLGPASNGAEVFEVREQGDAFRPFPLIVPQDANNVVVTAAGTWAHIAGNTSGPEGRTGAANVVGLLAAQYRNVTYISDGIESTNLPLNQLVGLWQPLAIGGATKEFGIGVGGTSIAIPTDGAKRKRLFLAFHDGQEWGDNVGSVQVSVTWDV